MTQSLHSTDASRPTVWGLSADELHDGYWRAHGVQCIRRGTAVRLQPSADLFLLLEPDQLVHFDVRALADRLAWRAARVTRLRVVDHHDEPYGEQVELDERGYVTCIGRRYRHRRQSAYRVILTRRRHLARSWMQTASRREGWRRISRTVGIAHVDNWHCRGGCYTLGDAPDERRLIAQLVAVWPRPDRAIDGIHEARGGVWVRHGETLDDAAVAIGPLWVGRTAVASRSDCMIGPAVVEDDAPAQPDLALPSLRLREIRDIDPGDELVREAPARSRRLGYGLAKRTCDLAVSAIGLMVAAPLMAAIAVSICLADGRPILYGGLRQTRGGRAFRCWKFRTMYRNADEIKHTLATKNAADGPQFFMADDPRVLRVGRFLRRFHLDELPQLWNVLRGDMSLVGPRPSPDDENQKCPAWREIRLSVKPGITGLWQLRRTREPGLDFQEWIRYDIEYVEKAGFGLDLWILLSTLFVVLGKGVKHAPDEAG